MWDKKINKKFETKVIFWWEENEKNIKNTNKKYSWDKVDIHKNSVTFLTWAKLDNLKKDNSDFEKLFRKKDFNNDNFLNLVNSKNKNERYLFISWFTEYIKTSENSKAISIFLNNLKLQVSCNDELVLSVRKKYENLLFWNIKKEIEGYSFEWKDAFEELEKEKKKKLCFFDLIKFLNNLKNKNWKKLDIKKITKINVDFLEIEKNKLEIDFTENNWHEIFWTTALIPASVTLNSISKEQIEEKLKKMWKWKIEKMSSILSLKDRADTLKFVSRNLSNTTQVETVIEAQTQGVENEDLKVFLESANEIVETKKEFLNNENFQNILINLWFSVEIEDLTEDENLLNDIILELEKKENKNYKEIIFLKKLKEIKEKLEKIKKIENKYNLDQNLSEKLINTQYNDYRKNIIINEENFENTDDIINIIENSNLKQWQILNINFWKIKQNFNLEKINSWYKIILWNSEFFCKNTKEIKEILSFWEYFSKLWLWFLLKDIEKILYFFRKKTNFAFNLKDWLNIKEHKKIQEILAFLLDIKDLDWDLWKKDEEIKDLGNSWLNYFYKQAIKKDWFLRWEFRELEFEEKLENFKN